MCEIIFRSTKMKQNEKKKIQDVWIAVIQREIELFAIMRCGIKTHHRSNAFST